MAPVVLFLQCFQRLRLLPVQLQLLLYLRIPLLAPIHCWLLLQLFQSSARPVECQQHLLLLRQHLYSSWAAYGPGRFLDPIHLHFERWESGWQPPSKALLLGPACCLHAVLCRLLRVAELVMPLQSWQATWWNLQVSRTV